MNEGELRDAIIKPATQLGRKVEENLIKEILKDLGVESSENEPGLLPLLSYTLEQLWYRQFNQFLTLKSYNDLGGVRKTLENLAEETYKKLSEIEQRIADQIFIKLTQLGEGTPDTRKRIPLNDLKSSHESEDLVEKVVQKLAEARLIVTSDTSQQNLSVIARQDTQKNTIASNVNQAEAISSKNQINSKGAIIDVAHEALIRYWGRLQELLENNREVIRTERKIQTAAQEWQEKGKSKDYLLTGLRLGEAEEFSHNESKIVPVSALARELIKESREESDRIIAQEKERQQQELKLEKQARRSWQWFATLLGLTSIISISFLMYPEVLRRFAIWQGKMVFITGGDTIIGSNENGAYELEKPEQKIYIPSFKIDKFEVSNKQYRLCVWARYCDKSANLDFFEDKNFLNHPVVGITALEAESYCNWLEKSVPTNIQWERVARGLKGQKWPWGNENINQDYVNMFLPEAQRKGSVTVDSYPESMSNEGVYNLVGNVWEWTIIEESENDKNYALMGGSWKSSIYKITEKVPTDSSYYDSYTGIRCSKSLN